MMLSTVSSKGLGEGVGCFWANRNCGATRDITQRMKPACRACLVFMVLGFSGRMTKAFYRRGREGFAEDAEPKLLCAPLRVPQRPLRLVSTLARLLSGELMNHRQDPSFATTNPTFCRTSCRQPVSQRPRCSPCRLCLSRWLHRPP